MLVYWLLSIAEGPDAYRAARALLGSWYGLMSLFLWSLALFFHLCNGIRHLFWDAGYGFNLKTVDASGKAVIITTVLLTLITWGIGFSINGNAG